jgi:membrane-associated phospholipid phosphatase
MSQLMDTPPRRRAALIVTETTAPAPTALLLLLAVAWHSAPTTGAAILWGLLAATFASLIPFAFILRGVRRGRWADHHVDARERRRVPLLVGAASLLVGLAVLATGGAPRELVALVTAMLVGLAVTLLVTALWKISIHTSVAAGAVVTLALVFGPPLLVTWPLVGLVAWSRVQLDGHTWPQVAAGAVLGALVAASVFTPLR